MITKEIQYQSEGKRVRATLYFNSIEIIIFDNKATTIYIAFVRLDDINCQVPQIFPNINKFFTKMHEQYVYQESKPNNLITIQNNEIVIQIKNIKNKDKLTLKFTGALYKLAQNKDINQQYQHKIQDKLVRLFQSLLVDASRRLNKQCQIVVGNFVEVHQSDRKQYETKFNQNLKIHFDEVKKSVQVKCHELSKTIMNSSQQYLQKLQYQNVNISVLNDNFLDINNKLSEISFGIQDMKEQLDEKIISLEEQIDNQIKGGEISNLKRTILDIQMKMEKLIQKQAIKQYHSNNKVSHKTLRQQDSEDITLFIPKDESTSYDQFALQQQEQSANNGQRVKKNKKNK